MSTLRATLFGFAAILMWSLLALLTVASGTVPAFQLLAMTFAIAGLIASGRTSVGQPDSASISYPDFFAALESIQT